ncbi:sulfate permease [Aquimarina sp. ERC-38]|uniref:SulP family inorganic anion transporter n=1 Tax=Aquimarina sp. ERC-38 TaxID=2949996 RepID=UPI0022463BBE|nr:sulfate permease [Aquimarina sp. ERC-38]UZO80108.1 sulfate permease [Aquimarina sp. ERC-38]
MLFIPIANYKNTVLKKIDHIFPIAAVFRSYTRSQFKADLIAGITVSIVLIPQAMAYALLMGVPPIYGLYACVFPLFIYTFLGTSRLLSIGPVAVTAILVMSGVSQLAEPFSDQFLSLVIFSSLLIGLLQIILGVLRMGFLVNLISQPVLTGFISAAAIIIIVSQLGEALGISVPSLNTFQRIQYTFQNLQNTHVLTFVMCLLSILLIMGLRKWKHSFPGALFILLLSSLATYYFKLYDQGISVIGEVPKGLPDFELPDFSYQNMLTLLPAVLTITFIGYVGSIGIAKSLELKNKDHVIKPSQELLALGIAKVIGAFFQAVPSSGSYSRTAINDRAGGKTQISSLITAILVVISLLFLTTYFYYIPKAVLAAIILVSVLGLIDVKEAIHLWHIKRKEFIIMITTFIGTLIIGVELGIFIGVLSAYFFLQYHSSRPHVAELVKIPDTNYYRNILRFPEALRSEQYLIIRFDDQLYFANATYFKDVILKHIGQRSVTPKFLILDAKNMHDMDTTGLYILEDVYTYLENSEIQLLISGAIGPVRDFLQRSGFTDQLGSAYYFMTIADAVSYVENKSVHTHTFTPAVQYNERRSLLD